MFLKTNKTGNNGHEYKELKKRLDKLLERHKIEKALYIEILKKMSDSLEGACSEASD